MKKVKADDDDFDENAHSSLLKDIKKLNSNARSDVKRIVRVSNETVRTIDKKEILKRIGDSTLALRTKGQKSLPKPLEKPQAKRLKRAIGFEEVAVDANKWTNIVKQRRKTDQLKFPIEDVDVRVITTEKNFVPPMQSDLEKEIYPLLYGAKLIEEDKKESAEEVAVKRAMSLKEVREKSKLLWQRKLLRQRLEKKAAMLNKSKSRKFHKILRREKLKKKKEEFEQLKEKDPEKALEVLNDIEKSRIQERMDLRHKKSKWLHLQKDRAGRDKNVLELLQENKEISQEILQKIKAQESEDEYEQISDDEFKGSKVNKSHELMNSEEEKDDFMKFQSQIDLLQKEASSEPLVQKETQDCDKVIIQPSEATTRVLGASRKRDIFSKQWSTNLDSDEEDEDVVNFENIYNEEELIAEFEEEKKRKEEEKAKGTVDDGKIKGWGSWVGPGIEAKESSRQRKRRILRTNSEINKTQPSKSHIIYNESADINKNVRKHMVSELPFPFSRVKDFEASIRQPIGRKYIPEIAHKMLIAPPIVKKMGAIINPIDEDALLKANDKHNKKISKLEKKFNEQINPKAKIPRKKMGRKKKSSNKNSNLKSFVIHK